LRKDEVGVAIVDWVVGWSSAQNQACSSSMSVCRNIWMAHKMKD
jgi:hypothetical protein